MLIANLPKTAPESQASLGVVGGVASMKDITKDLKDFSTSGLIQNFQSLLKEGDPVRLTDDEKVGFFLILPNGLSNVKLSEGASASVAIGAKLLSCLVDDVASETGSLVTFAMSLGSFSNNRKVVNELMSDASASQTWNFNSIGA